MFTKLFNRNNLNWQFGKQKRIKVYSLLQWTPEMMFQCLVKGRLKIEFAYYRLINNVVFFVMYGVLMRFFV